MLNDTSILILAGGKSSRMGTDKGFLELLDQTFVGQLVNESKRVSNNIYISVGKHNINEYQKYQELLIQDHQDGNGPIGGIVSALDNIKTKWFFILSVDTPLVNSELLESLWVNKITYEAVVYELNSQIQPLVGLYHKTTESKWKKAFNDKKFRITSVVNSMNIKRLNANEREIELLKNINTPEEYRELLGIEK